MCDHLARKSLVFSKGIQSTDIQLSLTLVIPVKGATPFSADCFSSWLKQDYEGELEIIFSLEDPMDSALKIIEKLKNTRPFRIIVNPIRQGFSGKMSNLFYGIQSAKNELIISSDSDIVAPDDTVKKIVSLIESGKDIVSCLPRHVGGKNLWGKVLEIQWNVGMMYLWAPSLLRNRPLGIAGGTFALKKGILNKIGGLEAFKDYVAEDLALGMEARRAGLRIGLGPPVQSPIGIISFREIYDKLTRASLSNTHMSPWGMGTAFVLYMFFYAYLPILLGSLFLGQPYVFLLSLGYVLASAIFMGRLASFAGNHFRFPYENIIGDILAFSVFLITLFKKDVCWGGIHYRVGKRGRMSQVRKEI